MNIQTNDNRRQQLYRLAQAAEQLQISQHTLRTWCKTGRVSYHRMGNLIMISQGELSRIIDQSQVAAV